MSDHRIRSLRICWLEAFVAVAQLKNYSEASRRMECDQSTISRYIIHLQHWLRKQLLTGYVPTILTEDGEEFLPKAIEICRLLRESRSPVQPPRPKISAKYITGAKAAPVLPPAPTPPPGRISAAHIDMSFWKKPSDPAEDGEGT
jgi:DNA-binding transcriptional LysR family regulator